MSSSLYSFVVVSGLVAAAIFTSNAFFSFKKDVKSVHITESTCQVISQALSPASEAHWPGSSDFDTDIHHWTSSATKKSTCSVTPGNADDLSKIVQIIGWTRTPFAITGGGHSINPGFSSTAGIHIAMSRFTELKLNEEGETVDIGAGLLWDDVYGYLGPKGYSAVGGRVNGPGVAGFILGGGLGWTTNRYGLTVDTLMSCEIVLPNGTLTTASADVNPDLFFGLKGGFNNFGIVTRFTLKVFPQTDVWGGAILVPESEIENANIAVANYAANSRDPKATMNVIYEYVEGVMHAILLVFYDAPEPPVGIFDEFLSLKDSVVKAKSMPFLSLLAGSKPRIAPRRAQDVASVQKFTPSVLNKAANETKYWGSYLEKHHSGLFCNYIVEVFLPDYLSHGPASAWPADRSVVHYPIDLAFAWRDEQHDSAVYDAIRQSSAQLRAFAASEGQEVYNSSPYPNLVLADTPLERIYGKNLGRLREIRDVYDPHRVMDLAGGWHF